MTALPFPIFVLLVAGATITKVYEAWVHRSGIYPFARWWEAVQAGRRLPGVAGQLAKMTGNALWGRFCMDGARGRRVVRWLEGPGLATRPLKARPGQYPAHDLAETVSGRVRAELFLLMHGLGDRLVSAHTDGAWVHDRDPAPAADSGLYNVFPEGF